MSLQNVNLTQGSGLPAVGTTLAVGNNGSPLVYNLIGNQAKIATDLKTDTADTTNQGSEWDQSIPTLLVGGEVSVEIFYQPSSQGADGLSNVLVGHAAADAGALVSMLVNQQIRPWRLTWPDGSAQYFEAFPTTAPVTSDPTGKALMMAFKIKITGSIFFVDA